MENIEKPKVKLVGKDGNAFNLIALCRKALREAGLEEQIKEFTAEATSGDYDHLLQTCCKYCDVE